MADDKKTDRQSGVSPSSVSFMDLVKEARKLEQVPSKTYESPPPAYSSGRADHVLVFDTRYESMSYPEILSELKKIDKIKATLGYSEIPAQVGEAGRQTGAQATAEKKEESPISQLRSKSVPQSIRTEQEKEKSKLDQQSKAPSKTEKSASQAPALQSIREEPEKASKPSLQYGDSSPSLAQQVESITKNPPTPQKPKPKSGLQLIIEPVDVDVPSPPLPAQKPGSKPDDTKTEVKPRIEPKTFNWPVPAAKAEIQVIPSAPKAQEKQTGQQVSQPEKSVPSQQVQKQTQGPPRPPPVLSKTAPVQPPATVAKSASAPTVLEKPAETEKPGLFTGLAGILGRRPASVQQQEPAKVEKPAQAKTPEVPKPAPVQEDYSPQPKAYVKEEKEPAPAQRMAPLTQEEPKPARSVVDKIEETKKKIESMAPKTAKDEKADAEELERLGKYWREREEPQQQDDPLARLREYKKKKQGDWGGK
jgi:hypothetical protein